jgi:hypothetical protein
MKLFDFRCFVDVAQLILILLTVCLPYRLLEG